MWWTFFIILFLISVVSTTLLFYSLRGLTKLGMANSNMMSEILQLSNLRQFVTSQVPPGTQSSPNWSNSYNVTKKQQNT